MPKAQLIHYSPPLTQREITPIVSFLSGLFNAATPEEWGPGMSPAERAAIYRAYRKLHRQIVRDNAYVSGDDCQTCGMPVNECGHVRPESR